MVRALLTGACCLMISVTPGVAADMPVKAAKPVFAPMVTWTGFYVGGHIGYGSSRADLSAADSAAITATYGAVPAPDGFVGGLHGGYDYQMANRIVLGVGVEINGFGIDASRTRPGSRQARRSNPPSTGRSRCTGGPAMRSTAGCPTCWAAARSCASD